MSSQAFNRLEKRFEKLVFTASLLDAQHERNIVENKQVTSRVACSCFLGNAFNGIRLYI